MRFSKILDELCLDSIIEEKKDFDVTGVADDSRKVEPGNIFVAVKGTVSDGHKFVREALSNGAQAVFVEDPPSKCDNTIVIRVPDTRETLGRLAHCYFGYPSQQLKTIGITGTNGKTTVAYLVESVLGKAGFNPGVIGTIEYRFGNERRKAPNTTPSPLTIAELMNSMRKNDVRAVVMEVTSHAIDQKRIEAIAFDVGVFTNITQDHLDYHHTMDEYIEVKEKFFNTYLCGGGATGIFNIDDEVGEKFYSRFKLSKFSYGTKQDADYFADNVRSSLGGTEFEIRFPGGKIAVESELVGLFSVSNILAAFASCHSLGLDADLIVDAITEIRTVPGRFERVDAGQDFHVIVDYAHTPDALNRAIRSAREICGNKIIVVFGCGGDRDRAKRPIMGKDAGDLSDVVIITNDNPRSEPPSDIARAVEEGVKSSSLPDRNYKVILDRREAIGEALSIAETDDLVLIAGKGHEDYQIIGSNVLDFDDRLVVREIIGELLKDSNDTDQ